MKSDVDIDLADREQILKHIDHVAATMNVHGVIKRHTSGVYITDVPYDPIADRANITYDQAEDRGYLKLDFLNLWVYKYVKNEQHLVELMREPDWNKLTDHRFVEHLIHLANHYESMMSMPEPINSIPRLAMFLSAIRPGKRHLLGKTWREVSESIWDRAGETGYTFKKSNAISYAQLVVVHMNLLIENPDATNLVDESISDTTDE